MRRHSLMLLIALMAMGAGISVGAQNPGPQVFRLEPDVQVPATRQQQAKPEAVVARLMSFDTNRDGRITRAELPERMQPLLSRADVTRDGALDGAEVLRLAQQPPAQAVVRGLQPGQYGFGDEGELDTRLHIEGAIDDLRLASVTRDKALGIGRKFADGVKTQAKADLLAAASPLLSVEQMTSFKAALDRNRRTVVIGGIVPPQGAPGGGSGGGGTVAESLQALAGRQLVLFSGGDLTRVVNQFQLGADEKRQLQAAVERFKAHDRLTDAERATLLKQLRSVLNDQERDDLRAALERRPIVKQEGALAALRVQTRSVPPSVDVPAQPQFKMQDLLLRQ